jgi:NAD-dependent dihydropyrimidine dehydrogenase PreA subunit
MAFVVTSACTDVKDKTCTTQCPVDCIYEGARKLYINPDECIDCGACEAICPVNAIFQDSDVPASEAGHVEANAAFFATIGSPGGAESAGPFDWDSFPATASRS